MAYFVYFTIESAAESRKNKLLFVTELVVEYPSMFQQSWSVALKGLFLLFKLLFYSAIKLQRYIFGTVSSTAEYTRCFTFNNGSFVKLEQIRKSVKVGCCS